MAKRVDSNRSSAPPRDALFRAMGFGAARLRVVYGVLLFLAIANVVQAVMVYRLNHQATAERFVVVVDGRARVLELRRATDQWQPSDGAWINAATEWLRDTRARPSDPDTWRWQREQIRNTTTREIWPPLNEWMVQTREAMGGNAVEFELIEATIVHGDEDNASVYVRWRERKRVGSSRGAWTLYHATVALAKVPGETAKEITANPTGLYVVDYSFVSEAP